MEHYFFSYLGQLIYTIPFIPLYFGPYISPIDIALSHSPQHRSPPHILLLRPLFCYYPPAHPMSPSIFSSPGHIFSLEKIICTSGSFVPHTARNHRHNSMPFPDRIPTLGQCWFNVVHYNGPWMAYNVGPV